MGGRPPTLLPIFLGLFNGVADLGNGGPGAILGSAADAFSCGLVEVFEDPGQPRLRYSARGNPDYLAGANDPNDVVDRFSFELPRARADTAIGPPGGQRLGVGDPAPSRDGPPLRSRVECVLSRDLARVDATLETSGHLGLE